MYSIICSQMFITLYMFKLKRVNTVKYMRRLFIGCLIYAKKNDDAYNENNDKLVTHTSINSNK